MKKKTQKGAGVGAHTDENKFRARQPKVVWGCLNILWVLDDVEELSLIVLTVQWHVVMVF